ncbi:MAG: flagellar M-ring protein FliF [Alphaproteobacteria bacterium]|nr:flagellar M-ring protein FliF [Alphaproteobacteria bacterium]
MNSFVNTLKQLGPARLGIMAAVLLGLLMFFIFVSVRVSTPDLKLLYADLSTMDSAAVAAKLEESQIKYQVSPDGTRIEVPENDVGRARMLLAQEGLPNGGNMGYEIFDRESGFGTTNFIQNLNQLRALEGELSRTIGSLQPIKSARVHLVLPQRELFARDTRPATASVFLTLNSRNSLDKEQIAAIQSLVSSAVPELKPSNVSIIDSNGSLLARGGDEGDTLMNMKAEEMRRSYETRMTQAIESLVSNTVGFGKVRANVTADLNFDRISTSEESYDPEGQVVRSTQTIEENALDKEPAQNNVSVENNLPAGLGGDTLGEGASSQSNRVEETTNFEISKTVKNLVREVGEVKRMSVAVLVDGNYTTDAEGNKTYQPRTQEQLDKISALVKSAIGFDEARGDKIEVVNMQFAEIQADDELVDSTLFGFQKTDLLDAAEIVTVAIMIILVILLVLQPMVGRLLATEAPSVKDEDDLGMLPHMASNPALSAPNIAGMLPPQESADDDEPAAMIDMNKVEGQVKASSIKKIEEIVTSYPAETVSVLRSWMTQE